MIPAETKLVTRRPPVPPSAVASERMPASAAKNRRLDRSGVAARGHGTVEAWRAHGVHGRINGEVRGDAVGDHRSVRPWMGPNLNLKVR